MDPVERGKKKIGGKKNQIFFANNIKIDTGPGSVALLLPQCYATAPPVMQH